MEGLTKIINLINIVRGHTRGLTKRW